MHLVNQGGTSTSLGCHLPDASSACFGYQVSSIQFNSLSLSFAHRSSRLNLTPPNPVDRHTTMVLGRLTHYALDAIAISTIFAGVKKTTGFA